MYGSALQAPTDTWMLRYDRVAAGAGDEAERAAVEDSGEEADAGTDDEEEEAGEAAAAGKGGATPARRTHRERQTKG